MTDEERKVWNIIQNHVGKSSQISKEQLLASTGLDDRTARRALRSLRINHGRLICYSQGFHGGYFVAASIDELRECREVEWTREQSVRENRVFYDDAISAAGNSQGVLF